MRFCRTLEGLTYPFFFIIVRYFSCNLVIGVPFVLVVAAVLMSVCDFLSCWGVGLQDFSLFLMQLTTALGVTTSLPKGEIGSLPKV